MRSKKLNFLTILLLALFVFPIFSFTQEIVDVPLDIGGDPFGVLNKFIMGDTTSTGERAHPDGIYRLQRGQLYDCDLALLVNFNFSLIADDDDPANPVRPPMIIRGVKPDGTYNRYFFKFIEDGLNIKFKNILFQGVRDDELVEAKGPSAIRVEGTNHRIVIDNCVFNGFSGTALATRSSASCSYILKNNIFRNAVGLESPFSGSVYGSKLTRQDTVQMVNNTFFNYSGYIYLSIKGDLIDYAEFSHNTIYKNTINGLWCPYLVNAKMNDNLIYNYQTVAQSDFEIASGYYDKSGQPSCIAKLYPLDPALLADWGKTEADRNVEYKNNVYAWSQNIKDYWATGKDEAHNLPLIPVTWMNDSTKVLFGDKTAYPLLVDENNDELDPGFDAAINTTIMEKEMPFIKLFRKYGYGNLVDPQERLYYSEAGKMFEIEWPLLENLSYTNTEVLTHAEGGFPAGDLNWFPDKKAEWEDWLTGVKREDNASIPSEYTLSQHYPNPFIPTTEISFSIPASGNTTLAIYNVLGQKVATLVSKELTAGSYKYQFDASNLTSGIYFYKLQSNEYSQVRKMMLLK
jgi:hypothetical protein